MKKLFVVLVIMSMLVACSGGSGTTTFSSKNLLSPEETKTALRNPEDNKGESVELSGYIFNLIDEDDEYIYAQIYQDFENYKEDAVLKIPKEVTTDVDEEKFIYGQGVILGEMKGENLFGGDLTTSVVEIDNILIGDFKDTVAKTNKEHQINMELTQHNHTVVIDKIEFSDYDTRLYVKINNDSDAKVSLSTYDFTFVINGKNHKEDYSYYGEYPEIDSELNPNTHTDGIISFEPIDYEAGADVKIVVDSPYSDNWDNEFHDYIFDFTLE